MRKLKETTVTHLVEEYIRTKDDLLSAAQIQEGLKQPSNRVFAALHSLRNYKVVDAMEVDGKIYWYPLDPLLDTRTRTVPERAPETKPRKRKKHYVG